MIETNIIDLEDSNKIKKYDRARLRASVMLCCLSVGSPEGQADDIANFVCDDTEKWLADKQEVTTKDMINKSAKFLEKYHTEASYFYEQKHLII